MVNRKPQSKDGPKSVMSTSGSNPTKRIVDQLRIHVVWADGSLDAARIAELLSQHFDGIGMERDGVAYRVPVRFVSVPWESTTLLPAYINLERAKHNAIVLLHDDIMQDNSCSWDDYVCQTRKKISRRGNVDFIIPFGSPSGDPPLPSDASRNIQYAYRKAWVEAGMSTSARDNRLLLHTLYQIRHNLALLRGKIGQEKIFVSHAKADGDEIASSIVSYVNDKTQDVSLHTFYDAKELNPGEDFGSRFVKEIGIGTLLAIVSDTYDTRPWCVSELTTAKQERRPIVLADVGQRRISRTYPYGANLPKVRVNPVSGNTDWIDKLLVEVLSEGLRCDLFERQAENIVYKANTVLVLPRPPELFDLIDAESLPELIVYPDPPLGKLEERLLTKALKVSSPNTRLVTLGELS